MKKRGNFFKSLRFRILIILIILGIVPSVITVGIVINNYEDKAINIRVSGIRNQCEILCNLLIKSNYLNDSSSEAVNGKLELLSNVYGGRIILVDRDFRVVKDTYHVDEGKVMVSPEIIRCFKGENNTGYIRKNQTLEIAVPVKSPDVQQLQGAMLVTFSCNEITATVAELEQKGILIIGIIVVLAVLLGYILSTVLVKPFARVTKAIEDLTDGYQNEEISVPDYTETVLITDAFNKMVTRMKVLDESRQEFVSNVSHELKTPLTSMKVLADSLVGQQGVPEELYQEFMQDITAEIDRENKIITDLLALVKMDKKTSDLNISHMDINQLLEDILKRLRPIADKRHIDLILDSFRTVEADVDEIKFTSAISNLVENGIKYNVDDGWVRVSLDADHKYFYVTVADSGLGIPEDSIDRIFERFYRVDKSHSKEIGGTGLGLAITRSSIAMHHGVIKVFSREGEGTTFSVRIPLSYIP
ncbi:MAG: ATP-binding protein [Blautia sp.]|nr:cell wall metabolism sensor histidine kinase WalK [Blautia sp.]MDY3999047.1 ATP-binding protein [Blautia sp.]